MTRIDDGRVSLDEYISGLILLIKVGRRVSFNAADFHPTKSKTADALIAAPKTEDKP